MRMIISLLLRQGHAGDPNAVAVARLAGSRPNGGGGGR